MLEERAAFDFHGFQVVYFYSYPEFVAILDDAISHRDGFNGTSVVDSNGPKRVRLAKRRGIHAVPKGL
ncbi:MAG: hypothetical protein USCAAHI_01356 [Beijerinckiaceae bacterium]|jgi:hypothetical protein|nr:MAG: hypothetical protein USCAAHI_01356 [Beijerinckiaceae bacterium]